MSPGAGEPPDPALQKNLVVPDSPGDVLDLASPKATSSAIFVLLDFCFPS